MNTNESGAVFSECRNYRYLLWRHWGYTENLHAQRLMIIGLNPSTADENTDDPTIRRCIQFAKSWGFGGIIMTNLFAIRATDPREMKQIFDPVGKQNDLYLKDYAANCGLVLAAWGSLGAHQGRDAEVFEMLNPIAKLHCLGVTKYGFPRHPLYVRGDTLPVVFKP